MKPARLAARVFFSGPDQARFGTIAGCRRDRVAAPLRHRPIQNAEEQPGQVPLDQQSRNDGCEPGRSR